MKILTASWFTRLPADHIKIGTSRGAPRMAQSGYRRYRALEPGKWFHQVSPAEYLRRYNAEVLAPLDPDIVVSTLETLSNGKTPVLVCFEAAAQIQTGITFCHRHLIAKWLEDKLAIEVEEFGHPMLDRFARFRMLGVDLPSYR